ncbi:NADP-dependent malic enzyme, mitochondrial-like [Notothenia coriiceps]|uniref:NADP-dependent malic enzyme n=1 Tax=Notothenia coriiceps TaxID=8208 RepID=A0A6I9PDN1_9TELE|nr:PREDICTED: NADP-dependent malic enzyme, mitochondrial-like [Notothenia coriiceps]
MKAKVKVEQDLAFSLEERHQLGIHGLLPPCFNSQDIQLLRVLKNYEMKRDDLDRYVFLMGLQDRNEKLFYRLLTSDIERFMPVIYTPTVGLACQQYGLIFRRPRGLFITIHDRGHISTILQNWPEKDVRAVCVTDGERILGLGDLGCCGMGIPVGKLALYTACGGVPPQQCLPIMLDVGTDNEVLLKDPLYIGLRHERVRGRAYDDLLDEFMKAVSDRYGMDCLIQFEDFANVNAFRLLSKYRNKYCTFNDDIQGTAAVAVSWTSGRSSAITKKQNDGDCRADHMAMEKRDLALRIECLKRSGLVDSKGLIVKGRDSLTHEKERFAHEHPQMRKLEDVVHEMKPTAIIGVAAIAGAFTEQIIADMASFNERPIIFALSNPTSKAECTAEQCYTITQGRGIFASGSPFDPITLSDGRTFYPGQGNNAYIFPGVGLGVIACAVRHITEEIFLTSAEALADLVTEKDLAEGRLYPPLSSIREVSLKLAVKIIEYAYKHNMATLYPEPSNKKAYVHSLTYSTDYDEFAVASYSWPEDSMAMQSCKL